MRTKAFFVLAAMLSVLLVSCSSQAASTKPELENAIELAGIKSLQKEAKYQVEGYTFKQFSALSQGVLLNRDDLIKGGIDLVEYTFLSNGKMTYSLGKYSGSGTYTQDRDKVTMVMNNNKVEAFFDDDLDEDILCVKTSYGVAFLLRFED